MADDSDRDEADGEAGGESVVATVAEAGRLDKALAAALPQFSRSRLTALIASGAVRRAGTSGDGSGAESRAESGAESGDGPAADMTGERPVANPALKVKPGERFLVAPPPLAPAAPAPETVALDIAYEDEALIVVDKPAGMAVHPAPGTERGTLVNALLAHCAGALSGIGGVARPGIVHRLDKDTSGLLVVAKSDAAHAGLTAQFAARVAERRYLAVTWGAPDRGDPRLAGLDAVCFEPDGALVIDAPIARRPHDRKRMGVVAGGRRAVTRVATLARYGRAEKPLAALVACRLETGRTHQIRVHLAHVGHPLIGDPAYGRARPEPDCARAFPRQALHAERLGFRHPLTGEVLRFTRKPPEDFARLVNSLEKL